MGSPAAFNRAAYRPPWSTRGSKPAVTTMAGARPDTSSALAGDPIVYRCYAQLVHGFAAFTGVVPAADIACREIAGLVREGLQGRIPCSAAAAN